MHDVLRFWLDRGIDGFRIDVVHLIGKDPALPDDPQERSGLPHVMLNDAESTHVLLRRLRTLVDSYPGDRLTIGEIVLSTRRVAAYYGNDDELHLVVQLPAALGAVGRRCVAGRDRPDDRVARPGRRVAHVGHRQPRLGAAALAIRIGRACSGRGGAPADAPGHAVPLRGRRARARRRSGHGLPGARSRRSRRMPRSDPVGEAAAPRLGRSGAVAAVSAQPVRDGGGGATRRSQIRCSGCTATSSRCDEVQTHSARGRSRGSRDRTECSSTSA